MHPPSPAANSGNVARFVLVDPDWVADVFDSTRLERRRFGKDRARDWSVEVAIDGGRREVVGKLPSPGGFP